MCQDKKYKSCKLCSGSGFVANKIEKEKRQNIPITIKTNLEDLSPYVICYTCFGTGKEDYKSILEMSCCVVPLNIKNTI